jgi:hypothetical protein
LRSIYTTKQAVYTDDSDRKNKRQRVRSEAKMMLTLGGPLAGHESKKWLLLTSVVWLTVVMGERSRGRSQSDESPRCGKWVGSDDKAHKGVILKL